MKNLNHLFLLFLIIIFVLGLYMYSFNRILPGQKEGMENNTQPTTPECPDMLVNKGDVLLLYSSKKPIQDGVNPIVFQNLDEYIRYLDTDGQSIKHCNLLYLQLENDTQGNFVYRVRPSPFNQQGGLQPKIMNMTQITENSPPVKEVPYLDASRDQPPYNAGNYHGFDPIGLHQGRYTEIDRVHDSTEKTPVSDNAADPNWGGILHTQQAIASGKYDENNIYKPTYYNTRNTVTYPHLFPDGKGPPNYS
jgi:hypothetical protein